MKRCFGLMHARAASRLQEGKHAWAEQISTYDDGDLLDGLTRHGPQQPGLRGQQCERSVGERLADCSMHCHSVIFNTAVDRMRH